MKVSSFTAAQTAEKLDFVSGQRFSDAGSSSESSAPLGATLAVFGIHPNLLQISTQSIRKAGVRVAFFWERNGGL